MWADILTGKAPQITIPQGRVHRMPEDTEENETEETLKTFELKQTYGKLTVLRLADCKKGLRWWCQCECGNVKAIPGSELRAGKHRTCGCGQRKRVPTTGYAKFGHVCPCGCGRVTEKYKVVKGYRKACYMRLKHAGVL